MVVSATEQIVIQISFHIFFFAGPIVYSLDLADRIILKTCPFLAGGILIGSVYWTAVTYGAVTVMQVREMS